MNEAPHSPGADPGPLLRAILRCLVFILLILAGYTVIYAKPVLLPLALALLITLVLRPVHRILCGWHLPSPLAAAVSVLLVMMATVTAVGYLSAPAVEWGNTLDLRSAEAKIREILEPVQEVQEDIEDVAERVDALTNGETEQEEEEEDKSEAPSNANREVSEIDVEVTAPEGAAEDLPKPGEGDPVAVQIREKPSSTLAKYAQSVGVHAAATLMLIFFFLSYGDSMMAGTGRPGKAAGLVETLNRDVSTYLFTISAINAGLGVVTALAMWALGMPNPMLWGAMAMLLNFIPYVGALAGTCIVALVALVTYESVALVVAVPLVYLVITSLEGSMVTPMIIGRRFSLNPIVVVVWFLSWGAMWGVPGLLIANPTLMGFKIVCSRMPSLAKVDRVISR